MTWLEKIVPSLGLLVGIVFVAIGAVMGGGAVLKMVAYNPESFVPYNCEYDYRTLPTPEAQVPTQKTPGEIEVCKMIEQKAEATRYLHNKKENAIDGVVFLITGIIFWILFAKQRRI